MHEQKKLTRVVLIMFQDGSALHFLNKILTVYAHKMYNIGMVMSTFVPHKTG